MKKLTAYFSILFIAVFSVIANAQITPLDDEALPEFLYNSKLVISPTDATTPVKFTTTFTAILGSDGMALPATRTFKLYHMLGGTLTELSSQMSVSNADFGKNAAVLTKEFSFLINKSKLNGGTIGILYDIPASLPGGVGTAYNYWVGVKPTTPNPDPTPGGKFPTNDARFIKPFKYFSSGAGVIAQNGIYTLNFQHDGNLVLYKARVGASPEILWASDTNGKSTKSELRFDDHGNLTITKLNGDWIWDARKENLSMPNLWWVLQDDGNFVGYESYRIDENGEPIPYGRIIGSTGTYGGVRSNHYGKL